MFSLQQHLKFYTTFSVEETNLNMDFEKITPQAFSLLHYCHEGLNHQASIQSIIILGDPSQELENAYHEAVALQNFLKPFCKNFSLQLITNPLDNEFLDQKLTESHVIHFCGHIDENGLKIGKKYYHPHFSATPIHSLLYLNACALPNNILVALIKRRIKNLVYNRVKIEDNLKQLDRVQLFYLGLILGYRIGDVARKTLDFKKQRLYGWMTNRYFAC
jgi:hypothetical protein